MIIMAIDFGKVRTGLAICDPKEILAFPLEVITEKNEEILCEKIAKKIDEQKVRKRTHPQQCVSHKTLPALLQTICRYAGTGYVLRAADHGVRTVSAGHRPGDHGQGA